MPEALGPSQYYGIIGIFPAVFGYSDTFYSIPGFPSYIHLKMQDKLIDEFLS